MGWWVRIGTAALAFGAGCTGELSERLVEPEAPPLACMDDGSVTPGPSPIRRLTRAEYNNTIADLLGDTSAPADAFPAEEKVRGFDNNAANLGASDLLVEAHMKAAEAIAQHATADLPRLLDCGARMLDEPACARRFIEDFGKRAFRRPLTGEEAALLYDVYAAGRAESLRDGIAMVIETVLQSPPFLYRVEVGASPSTPDAKVVALDDWERASRLSYFLWNSTPDAALLAAAEAGALRTPAQVEQQARRMLSDPRARRAVAHFHRQWLELDRVDSLGKSASDFPAWSSEIAELLAEESARFLDHVVFDGEGDLKTLLTASYTFLNAPLASFYGVAGPSGASFARVTLPPEQRAGILTHGSVMAVNAHSNQTSPVHRGKLVRERVLCDILPAPPADVVIDVPDPQPGETSRQRFAQHASDPACSGCHALMDPIGFGFERYDGVGRFRTHEDGAVIDATGTLVQSDVDGAFDGARELVEKLADSAQVRECFTRNWFRFAYGRGDVFEDACTIARLADELERSGGDIRELLVALTQTDAFLYKKVVP